MGRYGKLLIKPTKKKVLDFCKRIGIEIKAMNGAKQEDVIAKLNPILRGFANVRFVFLKHNSSYGDGSPYAAFVSSET
jgi:hypothetical protein